jgi:simple sugar transport system permease protein
MTTISQSPETTPIKRRTSSVSRAWARRYGLQIGTLTIGLIIWLIFVIGAPRVFLSPQIYQAFMSSSPFFAIMAIPLTLVIITGEIDLSFPSIMAIGMTSFAITLEQTGNVWLALVLCLVTGFLVGGLNGVLVVKLGIPSLIATIGTQFVWRGAVNIINGGNGTSLVSVRDTPLYNLLVGRGSGIPAQMIWTIIIAVLLFILLNRTRFGAHLYLVGDNIESARLMGIPVNARKMMTFALMGLIAAFAGVVASLEVSYFWPTLGEGFLLKTISSVFLGGTSVFGGVGSIFGTFVGSFIIGAIEAGIVAVGLSGFWTQFIYGLIIVISVAFQTFLSRKLK